jgi:putative transposase
MFALLCILLSSIFNWHLLKPIQAAAQQRYRHKPARGTARTHAKPAWVSQRILHLKLLMPQGTGVRKIAATFNRAQAAKRNTSNIRVSKTYVANLLRSHQLSLRDLHKSLQARAPSISTINRTWGVDLTGKKDQSGQLHFILGIIDHGSRKLLSLLVSSKHSDKLAQHLQQTASEHGKPRSIRTDNERCFNSAAFTNHLQTSSIRHQRIDLHCPWQNGRIERLFGTLKQQLNQVQIQSAEHLQSLLDEFKHWYNSIRLHQHLGYQTPQEVWQQQKPAKKTNNANVQPIWWTGWNGQLSGVQWQC